MTRNGILKVFLVLLCTVTGTLTAWGASLDTELHHRIVNARRSGEPYIGRDVILLSYESHPGTQVVSMALENESYRIFHTFERNQHGVFVLTMPRPEGMDEIRYRLVVDGMWTTDPNVPSELDDRGVRVSVLGIPVEGGIPEPGAKRMPDGSVRFVYVGDPNARVSLIGDFNRWDPYLTPIPESPVHPGVYTMIMKLPPESRYYRFVVNGREMTDPGNPMIARNGWGEEVSLLR